MLVGFEDTAELDLRVVVSLSPAEIMALRAGLPMSFALTAAHAEGVRCVLVSADIAGAEARAKMQFPAGRILTLTNVELEQLQDGRGGIRVTPASEESIPFSLVITKLRPAKPTRPLTPPDSGGASHRPWRRGVRIAFGLSMAVVMLLAVGDIQAVSIGLGVLIAGVVAWLAWDTWGRPARPVSTPPEAPASPSPSKSPLAPTMPDALLQQLSAPVQMTGPHRVVNGHPRARASLTG